MNHTFEDIRGAKLLYHLKNSNVDCNKHSHTTKRLKCICWKCYCYVNMRKEDEIVMRRKMLYFLTKSFYQMVKSLYGEVVPENIKQGIKSYSQRYELYIYNNNPLLESYVKYFDFQFLKMMVTKKN